MGTLRRSSTWRTGTPADRSAASVEKLHPTPALYPSEPAEFARALFLEEYADAAIVGVIGSIFFERFIKPNIMQAECDEQRVQTLLADELPPLLDYIEQQVPEDGDHILAQFSIADCAIGAQLSGMKFANEEIDAARWPKTSRYLEALLARPSFKTAMS